MKENENDVFIQTIREGGHGSEASVLIQLRNRFPGIGGKIQTQQVITAALREEYSHFSKTGHRIFFKHLLIKKLDDYFCRTRQYRYPHISRPLGSISGKNNEPYEAYLYEWTDGRDAFPWEYVNADSETDKIILREFDIFISAFDMVGIDLGSDITNADNGLVSQNLIHELYYLNNLELNLRWKRIDFGDRSIYINHDKLNQFVRAEHQELEKVLGVRRYELLILAREYISPDTKMTDKKMGKLEALTGEYRVSTLRHVIAKIISHHGNDNPGITVTSSKEEL